MNQFPVLNYQDFISADGDSLTTDSRKVAAVHGKRHDNVVATIRKRIDESGEFGLLNFKESYYINEQSKVQPMFHMTKNGYAFLVGKMTGAKAVQFQIAYINAFDAMAEQIKNQRLGLQFRHFELQLIQKGKKAKASIHGRGLNQWKQEGPVIDTAIKALEAKMNPQLPFAATVQ